MNVYEFTGFGEPGSPRIREASFDMGVQELKRTLTRRMNDNYETELSYLGGEYAMLHTDEAFRILGAWCEGQYSDIEPSLSTLWAVNETVFDCGERHSVGVPWSLSAWFDKRDLESEDSPIPGQLVMFYCAGGRVYVPRPVWGDAR